MKATLFFLLVTAVLGAASAQENIPKISGPVEFVFRFNPPDGVKAKLTYSVKRSRIIDGQQQSNDESESQSVGTFKKTSDGFEYSPETLSSVMRRNGTEINDPIVGLLSKMRTTYVINKSGEAIAVQGFGGIAALIAANFPPQVATALAPLLNEAALVSREKAEWNARYSDFADGAFKMGQVIDIQAPQQLPTGETITYTIRTQFSRWELCPSGQCIRLEQIYESDASALAKMAVGVVNNMTSLQTDTPATGARISGSLSRLIDPNTMLIYSERVQRSISMQMTVPGKGTVPTVQDELRSYSYSYE